MNFYKFINFIKFANFTNFFSLCYELLSIYGWKVIQFKDKRKGMQVKMYDPLRTHVIPERFCDAVSS